MLKLRPLDRRLTITARGDPAPPAPEIRSAVDAIWSREQARRASPMTDGRLFSVETRRDHRWSGRFVPYRWFVAQRCVPALFAALQVRPVAVSGLLVGPDGVVFGRRSEANLQFPGWWELAPSGGLDPQCRRADGTLDYMAQLRRELLEETGCCDIDLTRARPFVAIEDPSTRLTDIGVELHTPLDAARIQAKRLATATGEYEELAIVRREDLARFAEEHRASLVEVSRALLVQAGLLGGRDG